MKGGTPRVRAGAVGRFLRCTSGSMTIPAIVFFVVCMALGGMAVDLQRVYGAHSQMQAYVDDVALAAAAELDGQSGAIARSIDAACGAPCGVGSANGPLVSGAGNRLKFATDNSLAVERVIFFSAIGPDPGPLAATPTGSDTPTCTYEAGAWTPANCNSSLTLDKSAKFVEVRAVSRSISYYVLPIANFFTTIFGQGSLQAQLQLKATAGFKAKVCDIHPVMVCNPSEPAGNTNTRYPYTLTVGQQILMKASGNGAWGPGDFGLLQVPNDAGGVCNGNGAGALTCILALANPLTQCIDDTINVKPGQAETTSNGFNARFDIYQGSINKYQGNPLFAPSVNVTKGICKVNGGSCNYNGGNACPNNFDVAPSAAPSMPFPRDSNLQADTTGTVRFGNATWSATTYWNTNHPGVTYPMAALGATPTRYAVYRYEIDNNLIPNIPSGENGGATCTTPGVNNTSRDRRVMTMAVVNCLAANGGAGLQGNNTASNIPVVAYVQVFMTEPMGMTEDATGKVTGFSNSSNNLYGETVGLAAPNDSSGVYHVYPVLYR